MADNIEQTYLYMVTQMGQDQLNFEMPVYDIEGYNSWVDDGKVYVTPEGGSRETLLYYRSWDQDGDWGSQQGYGRSADSSPCAGLVGRCHYDQQPKPRDSV